MRLYVAATILVVGAIFASRVAAQVQPTAPTGGDLAENAAGHGSTSIVYYDTYANGFWLTSNNRAPIGGIHNQGLGFEASYNIGNNWTIYGAIDYFNKKYDGPAPDCPTTAPPQCANQPPLPVQHPEAQFVDDGSYHGTWQDITLGISPRFDLGGYILTPSATATIPSHDYPIYGFAAPGQRLYQLLLGATLAHQFDFTNFYYKVGYGYAFSQHVYGIDTGYQRYDGELGWFVNEKFSMRGFVTGRSGFGINARGARVPAGFDPYHKAQAAQHDYRAWGFGADYGFAGRYLVSASVQRLFWGDTVDNFRYALEARLTRNF